jgi:predicted ATPase/class 3 adenylate cyclase
VAACARCGKHNPENARFCAACGTALSDGCPSCGAELPPDARYCPACGAFIAPAEPAAPTRKLVTVVFCDIANSTPLGEQLDVETFRSVMSSYYAEMRTVLERHGGTVEKFIGDAVMAVFGVPALHDDDALRAVRAAIDMRAAIATLNEELQRTSGVELAIRTGIASGEVVAADASGGQAFATGEPVVVAERLESSCRAGEILIDETTYRLSRNAILVEPLDELLRLKGKSEAVRAWRLVGVLTGALPFARRLDAKLVGRERELALLERAFRRAADDRSCHLFTLLGVAGVGKSRLVGELLTRIASQATVLVGRCLPYGEGITFWPLMEVVKQAAGITLDLSAEQARVRIRGVLTGEADAGRAEQRIAATIGLGDDKASAEESFWAARTFLEALARRRPLLLVFDDLHWGAPTFLDLVEHLTDWSHDAPILLLCLARPELLEERPAWGGGKLNASSILLEPLTEGECDRLIENLLAGELPADVRHRISIAAEGNPLFIEELVAMLIDDGVLEREHDAWRVRGDLATISVPPTIQALLAARLDRLSPPERVVLQRASVVGRLFHRRALAALGADSDPALSAGLAALVRKELIRPAASSFAGDEAFRFRHILIRDAAYHALAKTLRAELHERYADWLEDAARDRLREFEEIAGYHLEQAFRYRAELGRLDQRGASLAVRAGERLGAAGRRALGRGDAPAAVNLLERATSLPEEREARSPTLLLDLGVALHKAGELARAGSVLGEAIELAARAGEEAVAARGRIERSAVHFYLDPAHGEEQAVEVARAAIAVFTEAGDELGLAEAWRHLAYPKWVACRLAEMEEMLQRALVHADRAGDNRARNEIRNMLCRAAVISPTPVERGIRRCSETLQQADRELAAVAEVALSVLVAMRGDFEEAREGLARSRAALEELGHGLKLAAGSMYAAYIELLADDVPAAERELRSGYGALERMGERTQLSTLAALLALALAKQGSLDEAESYVAVSREAASDEDHASQVLWRATRARILAQEGRQADAEELAGESVALAEATDFLDLEAYALATLGEVLQTGGRLEEAAGYLRRAASLHEAKGNVVATERTRAKLEALVGARPA